MGYVRDIQAIGGEAVYGPPNETESWQPIDAGHLGAVIKCLAKTFMEKWMVKEYVGVHVDSFERPMKNFEVWELNKISMREKRILMTHIYGNAWDMMDGPRYVNLMRSAFEKTGCLMTNSGKNDNMVTCEALKDAVDLVPVGVPWTNDNYSKRAWSGDKDFEALQDEKCVDQESDLDEMMMVPPSKEEAELHEMEEEAKACELDMLAAELDADAALDAIAESPEASSSSSSSSSSS